MIEYRTIDKSAWSYAQNEPDKVQYKEDGFDCLIVRNKGGALCGYVGLPEGHKYYDVPYQDIDIQTHGGLTFSGRCQHGDDPSKGICHIPEPGEPDNVYWIGFDCAHAWDLCPAYEKFGFCADATYRDINYVKYYIKQMILQLKGEVYEP